MIFNIYWKYIFLDDKFYVIFISRCCDLSVFGDVRHSDVIEQFNMAKKDLDSTKLYQIYIDGPKQMLNYKKELLKV